MKRVIFFCLMIIIVFNSNAQSSWGTSEVWEDTPVKVVKSVVDSVKTIQTADTVKIVKKSVEVAVKDSIKKIDTRVDLVTKEDSLVAGDHINIPIEGYMIEICFDRESKKLYVLQHQLQDQTVRMIPSGINTPFYSKGFITRVLKVYEPTKKEQVHQKLSIGTGDNYFLEVLTSENKISLRLIYELNKNEYHRSWSF